MKKTNKVWHFNVDIVIISKPVEIKNNSKYLTGYLDEVIRPLVLMLLKMNGYVETFKDKRGDMNSNNTLMSLRIGNDKLLEKYKTIWTKTEDLKKS